MRGTKALLSMLEKKGVDTVFGYPGGSVISVYDELVDSSIRHVLVRHEQCAAHMADGYARAKNQPGVCIATSGPGATNLVTGIATAYADSSPIIALTGQVAAGSLGQGAFQEVDAYSLLMPITKHSYRVLDVNRLPHAVSEAWEICQMGRKGPVHIDLPIDQMNADIDESLLDGRFGVKPLTEDLSGLHEAVQWIRESQRPLILVGGGAIDASEEVMELARIMRAPVVSTLMGMGVVPSSYDLNMGPLGLHGRLSALEMSTEADLIISVGSRFSDRTYSPHDRMRDPQGRVIHIDIDPTTIRKNVKVDVPVVADCRLALQGMLELAKTKYAETDWEGKHKSWCETLRNWRTEQPLTWNDEGRYVKPQQVMRTLREITGGDAIISTEVGQNQMWVAQFYDFDSPRTLLTSGGLGTMGYGLPAAVGAQFAYPDKLVIDVAGDGSIQMNIQEMATIVENRLPIKIIILNNGYLGMVRQWQELFYKHNYSFTSMHGQPDFVKLADAYGAEGYRITAREDLEPTLRKALASPNPAIVDVVIEPEEDVYPMVPAGASLDEMLLV